MTIMDPVIDPAWLPQTALVHAGHRRTPFEETAEAIFMTSGYVYASAEEAARAFAEDGSRFVYSRYRNPTIKTFEERLAAYEGAPRCFGTGSGMAAVASSLLCFLKAGDRVVAPWALFGSCLWIVTDLLPRYGIEVTMVDGTDKAQWEEALSRPAQAVFLETPSNPTLDIIDLPHVVACARNAGARVIVDNVFATPMLQKPFELGADVVIYSATKHIDGQGRCLGGAILCDDEFAGHLAPFLRHTGPALSPFNAWLLLKGLETLELRVERMTATAGRLAAWLADQPQIAKLRYPGHPSHPQHDLAMRQMKAGGSLIAFDVAGGKEAAFRFMNGLGIMKISNNLGDSKTLVTHPATTTHQRLSEEERARVGIGPGTIRVSIGLEAEDDLAGDLARALAGL